MSQDKVLVTWRKVLGIVQTSLKKDVKRNIVRYYRSKIPLLDKEIKRSSLDDAAFTTDNLDLYGVHAAAKRLTRAGVSLDRKFPALMRTVHFTFKMTVEEVRSHIKNYIGEDLDGAVLLQIQSITHFMLVVDMLIMGMYFLARAFKTFRSEPEEVKNIVLFGK